MTRRGQQGFTLPEVLIAFAILSLSLTILYQTISTAAWSHGAIETRALALEIAENQLASLGADVPFEEGEWHGASDDGRFEWALTAAPFEVDDSDETRRNYDATAYEVRVVVSWVTRGRSRELALTTLRLSPP